MSRSRKFLFYVIALALPLLLVVLAELLLRAVDYAEEYPLFVEAKGMPGYLQPNENVIQRYFAKPEFAPNVSPDTVYFSKKKPKDSFRIIVQGGSTAAGFPYGRWGSLAGMLQQRFKRLYPDKEIEVINTAMASVNSYTLLDFVDEIIDIQPDLVLIYAGHNEYLGIMGVGSAFAAKGGRFATLLYLKLKQLHLFRALENIYATLMSPNASGMPVDERTLMAKVAKEKDIPFESDLFFAGIEQFRGNMQLILQSYQEFGIQVIMGTLASNEKDQIPFSAIDNVSEEEVDAIYQLKPEQRANQIEQWLRALATKPANLADLNYQLGHAYLAEEKYQLAKEHLLNAKDNDTLRFRAPEAFNQVLQSLSEEFSIPIANVQQIMRSQEQGGVIGKQHMLEHLHPNTRGYFLLAQAYLEQILQQQFLPAVEISAKDIQLAWQEMPITRADQAYADFKIARLTSDYPFTSEAKTVPLPAKNTIEGNAVRDRIDGTDWLTLNRKLSPVYQREKDFAQSALISGLLADALPNNFNLTYIAGLQYKQAKNLALAEYYLRQAIRMKPESVNTHLSLAQNHFLLGKLEESMRHLKWVKSTKPDHPNIDSLIARVQSAIDQNPTPN